MHISRTPWSWTDDQRGWVVFYLERGGEFSLTVHDHEADACADLLARLTSDEHVFFELVSGAAPAAVADEAFDNWPGLRRLSRTDLDPTDWKYDDVPWVSGSYWRRYLVRIQCRPAAGQDALISRESRASPRPPRRRNHPERHPQRCPSWAGVASRMLNGEAVGVVLTSVTPARLSRFRYSPSVRSRLPVKTSIVVSKRVASEAAHGGPAPGAEVDAAGLCFEAAALDKVRALPELFPNFGDQVGHRFNMRDGSRDGGLAVDFGAEQAACNLQPTGLVATAAWARRSRASLTPAFPAVSRVVPLASRWTMEMPRSWHQRIASRVMWPVWPRMTIRWMVRWALGILLRRRVLPIPSSTSRWPR